MTPTAKAIVLRSVCLMFVVASSVICVAQDAGKLVGLGSFVFEPLKGKSVRLHYFIPRTATEESHVVIVCHGLSRNADDYRDRWIESALNYGLIIAAPEFTKEVFPGSRGYNLGNVFRDGNRPVRHELNDESDWTFSAIEPIFDEIKRRTGNMEDRRRLRRWS